ncbi:MAG: hypothetical protein A2Z32_05570 [Chloroflexi bacterium RBG_16_69_14]|nr:MAG: hypothetical protein A2Z32_05570 [Chloroflexi bacterium RBG_16_69_14]
MDRTIARVGSWAGLISVAGIAGYHLTLQLIARQRVSGTTDETAIVAYYQNANIALVGVEGFVVLVPFLVFFVALRESTGVNQWTRFLATVALAAGIAEVPAVLVEISAQAALVVGAQNGDAIVPLFRFWDVLYNSGTYVLEATWVVAFGLAMRGNVSFPRWMLGWSMLTGVLLAINVLAIWIGIPDPATLPSAAALAIWFVGASLGLRRLAASPSLVSSAQPA